MRNKDTIEKCLTEIKYSGLPVVVFGTGEGGMIMETFLKEHSINVDAFCESRDYYHPDKEIRGKPVFLFSLDYSEYMRTRGIYFDYFSLPFPVAQSNDGLCRNIQEFSEENYRKKWSDFSNKVGLVENGHASEAVADLIVRKLGGD